VQGGVLGDECGALLREFFVERREQYRQRRALVDGTSPLDEPLEIPAGEATEIGSLPPT
jgi:tRNA(adenine34) deaminase